ncbi:MAG: ABC transporter ATP-binding protein [Chloroflexi bacterium]|nr:ABC transporter ATP-binding protein [Chloroflexota bacterium]
MSSGNVLEMRQLFAGYGSGGDILRGVDLQIEEGDFMCLIGPNGAGKSTLLRTISGLVKPRQGSIQFRGQEIGGLRPDRVFRLGLAHVPQGRSTFPDMSVWENVLMGAYTLHDRRIRQERLEQACAMFPIVERQRNKVAGLLSGGEQKQVEMARATMTGARMILLDEPTLGLEPRASRTVVEKMQELNASGVTILLVEQNARTGLAASRTGCVMELGRIKLQGHGPTLLQDPEVKRLYLGQGGTMTAPRPPTGQVVA